MTIVGKALEKDPNRRYSSAAELGDDVESYLISRPIKARPPSAAYRMQKSSERVRDDTVYSFTRFVVAGINRFYSTPSLIAKMWVERKSDKPSSSSKS